MADGAVKFTPIGPTDGVIKFPRPISPASAFLVDSAMESEMAKEDREKLLIILRSQIFFNPKDMSFSLQCDEEIKATYTRKRRSKKLDTVVQDIEKALNESYQKSLVAGFKNTVIFSPENASFFDSASAFPVSKVYMPSPHRLSFFPHVEANVVVDEEDVVFNLGEYIERFVATLSMHIAIYQAQNNYDSTGFPADYNVTLQPKISRSADTVNFLRDTSVAVGDKLFIVDPKILELYNRVDDVFTASINSSKIDYECSGVQFAGTLPFMMQGGNVITFYDYKKRGLVMLIMVSNLDVVSYVADRPSFAAGFIDGGGEVAIEKNYGDHCKKIKEWGIGVGCKEVCVVDRNFSPHSPFKYLDNYHLDVSLGVINGYYGPCLMIPRPLMGTDGRLHRVIAEESFAALREIFDDRIIEIDEEDRRRLATNSIELKRGGKKIVLMTHPLISQNLVDKIIEMTGCQVALPPCVLTSLRRERGRDVDGIRCATQELTDPPASSPVPAYKGKILPQEFMIKHY